MMLETLSVSQSQATHPSIQALDIKKLPKSWQKAFRRLGRQRKHGMGLQKEESGIVLILRKCGLTVRKTLLSVRNAVKAMKPMRSTQNLGSVLQPVNLRQEEIAASTMKQEPAKSAKRVLSSTNMPKPGPAEVRIVGVNRLPEKEAVYDLTVEEEHCFYANGIVAHNCHDCIQYIAMYCDGGKTFGTGPNYKSNQRRNVKKLSSKSYG